MRFRSAGCAGFTELSVRAEEFTAPSAGTRQVYARSMLMDQATLLAHRGQWVSEPRPAAARLDLLDASEAELYRILVEGTLGPSVRLEQERVGFAAIERALGR